MHETVKNYARASEIASYYLCPRLVYFQRRCERAISGAGVRAGVFKSISYALSPVVSSPRPEEALGTAIRMACSDSLLLYGTAFGQTITNAGMEAEGRAREILAGLLKEKEQAGERRLMGMLAPPSVAVTIRSDKLCVSGTIDKVVDDSGTPEPVIISASAPPEAGIYASDRVKLAAYSLLLSEKYGVDCRAGAVEYVLGWCVRRAKVRYEDKRKALYARNRVLEMGEGRMPDAAKGEWCGRCAYYDSCNVKVSLLDSLFNKSANA